MKPAGAVVWFTGLPSSGKTTLALAVRAALARRRVSCALLDSDELRAAIAPGAGYGKVARTRFYASLARLAALLAAQGLVVLVAATAHRRSFRAQARRAAPRFLEVYVATPFDECARRNTKGLYGKGLSVPGELVAYQPPLDPAVTAPEGSTPRAVRECLAAILSPAPEPRAG
jgi:adenylylsulfate kinase